MNYMILGSKYLPHVVKSKRTIRGEKVLILHPSNLDVTEFLN